MARACGAWHVSGGEGWCANTTNKRVMVTHQDGRQTVEEIKDDLGVTSDQYGARLRSQGVNDAQKVCCVRSFIDGGVCHGGSRSVGRSVARSLGRSVARWIGRSVGRSAGRTRLWLGLVVRGTSRHRLSGSDRR